MKYHNMTHEEHLLERNDRYVITWNNPTLTKEEIYKKLKSKCKKIEYAIIAEEIGSKNQTLHIQSYVRLSNPIQQKTIDEIFSDGQNKSYIKVALGDDFQNQKYCSKDSNFLEINLPTYKHEENVDHLTAMNEDILRGMSLQECYLYHPNAVRKIKDFKEWYAIIRSTMIMVNGQMFPSPTYIFKTHNDIWELKRDIKIK